MVMKMLPEYAREVARPLGNIDKITVIDTGSSGESGGANKVSSYATNLMATLQESLKETSGIDVKDLLENIAGKHTMKGNLNPTHLDIEKEKDETLAANN